MYKRYKPRHSEEKGETKRPATMRGRKRTRRKRPSKALGIGCALAAIAVCATLCAILFGPGFQDDWYDQNAIEGSYEGKSEADIRADLERQIAEGMMNISIASNVLVSSETGMADLRIENIPGNHVDQKVAVTLDETGETLYRSEAIAPGTCVQEAGLSRTLAPGTYDATATFVGYDPQTHEEQGTSAAKITLTVE